MKRPFFIFFLLLALSFTGFAQAPLTDLGSKEEIRKLGFIAGEWKGTGWMADRSGVKHSFDQTEKVQFKLDRTALLIEGRGMANGSRLVK